VKVSRAIVVSLFSGWLFYAVVLGEIVKYRASISTANVLLWNVVVFNFLSGVNNDAPIFDGAAGFPGTTWVSFLSGFVLYPIAFFALFALRSRLKKD
jgi:hypothetical protein